MTADEARANAIALLQRRLAKGWSRQSVEATVYEGACGPSLPGYLMSSGRITIPSAMRHGDPDKHTFRLSDLFDEIESPQGGLFL